MLDNRGEVMLLVVLKLIQSCFLQKQKCAYYLDDPIIWSVFTTNIGNDENIQKLSKVIDLYSERHIAVEVFQMYFAMI